MHAVFVYVFKAVVISSETSDGLKHAISRSQEDELLMKIITQRNWKSSMLLVNIAK